jgi:hypothetical protein
MRACLETHSVLEARNFVSPFVLEKHLTAIMRPSADSPRNAAIPRSYSSSQESEYKDLPRITLTVLA